MKKIITYSDIIVALFVSTGVALTQYIGTNLHLGYIFSLLLITIVAMAIEISITPYIMHPKNQGLKRYVILTIYAILLFWLVDFIIWALTGGIEELVSRNDVNGGDSFYLFFYENLYFTIGFAFALFVIAKLFLIFEYWRYNKKIHLKGNEKYIPKSTDLERVIKKFVGENEKIDPEKCHKYLTVNTKTGNYYGCLWNNARGYFGIPYAKQPTGERRFKPAEKLEADDNYYTAHYFSKNPIQPDFGFISQVHYGMSEECLTLNVFRSADVPTSLRDVFYDFIEDMLGGIAADSIKETFTSSRNKIKNINKNLIKNKETEKNTENEKIDTTHVKDETKDHKLVKNLFSISEKNLDEMLAREEAQNKKLNPVLVYICGISASTGGAASPFYDYSNFVKKHTDVVCVTLSYRLGILGSINLDDVNGAEHIDKDKAKNLGFLDIVCALEWIKENISAFGGDSSNITLIGNGAGANIVLALACYEPVNSWIKKIICYDWYPNTLESDKYLETYTLNFMNLANCKDFSDLCKLDSKKICEVSRYLMRVTPFVAIGDGKYIPKNLFKAVQEGKAKNVDMILGTSEDALNELILYQDKKTFEDRCLYIMMSKTLWVDHTNAVKSFFYKKHQTKEDLKEESVEFLNMLFGSGAVFSIAQAQCKAGGHAYMFYSRLTSVYRELGAYNSLLVPVVTGGRGISRYYGQIYSDSASQILQFMIANFARKSNPSINKHDVTRVDGIDWEPFGKNSNKVLYITNRKIYLNSSLESETLKKLYCIKQILNKDPEITNQILNSD